MVKQEEIFKMLQEGADAGELAQQFADALNAAIAEKNAADAKKNAQATQKVAKMQAIINTVFNFIDEYYPDMKVPKEVREEVTAESVIDVMDQTADEIKQLVSLTKTLKNDPFFQKVMEDKPARNKISRDPIADFLKANGLA